MGQISRIDLFYAHVSEYRKKVLRNQKNSGDSSVAIWEKAHSLQSKENYDVWNMRMWDEKHGGINVLVSSFSSSVSQSEKPFIFGESVLPL